MTKIALCTPAYDGRALMAYYRGVNAIRLAFQSRGIETAHMECGCSANLPRLRNALTAQAFDWGADAILWIDSDIMGSGEDALRLWDSGKDIIGAAPQKRPRTMDEPAAVAFSPLEGGTIALTDGLVEVGCVATAFCLTRKAVFEALRDEGIAKLLCNRDGPRSEWFCNFFWYELVETDEGFLDDGEDYYFCRKARELGFKCHIEPNIRPVHHEGGIQLTVNFWDLHGAQFAQEAAE